METRRYELTFLTPGFLGDADQSARWRTPPIKHLLREWWRVAWAQDNGFPVDARAVHEMRAAEGCLFGNAWLDERDGGHARSQVRIRLDRWNQGSLTQWPGNVEGKVRHPEVGKAGMPVGAELYLGYGPLSHDRAAKATVLKANAAIKPGEQAMLRVAAPAADIEQIDRAMSWANRYGALGGRARNGWGAFELVRMDGQTDPVGAPLQSWQRALDTEWANAIGMDERGPLIWQTEAHQDWHALMQTLAKIKIGFRTRFQFTSGKGAARPEPRHWLSYPVTKHDVRGWQNLRLPNSLRFTARRDERGALRGVIYHMPVRPIREFQPDDRTLLTLWAQVHQYLDQENGLNRIQE